MGTSVGLMSGLTKRLFPYNVGIFLTRWGTISV